MAGRVVFTGQAQPDDLGRYPFDARSLTPGACLLELQPSGQPPRSFKLIRP